MKPENGSLESSRPRRTHIQNRSARSCEQWIFTLCGHLLPAGAIVPADEAACGNCRRIYAARVRDLLKAAKGVQL